MSKLDWCSVARASEATQELVAEAIEGADLDDLMCWPLDVMADAYASYSLCLGLGCEFHQSQRVMRQLKRIIEIETELLGEREENDCCNAGACEACCPVRR